MSTFDGNAAARYTTIAALYRERAAAIASPAESVKLARLAEIYDRKVQGLNRTIIPAETDVMHSSDSDSPKTEKPDTASKGNKLFQFEGPKRRPRLGPSSAVHGSD